VFLFFALAPTCLRSNQTKHCKSSVILLSDRIKCDTLVYREPYYYYIKQIMSAAMSKKICTQSTKPAPTTQPTTIDPIKNVMSFQPGFEAERRAAELAAVALALWLVAPDTEACSMVGELNFVVVRKSDTYRICHGCGRYRRCGRLGE
jgi:hypothetical protein